MIKRIKKKYAIIVMSSVIIVLGLIITAINVTNYSYINSLLDEKLTMLVENDGLIPRLISVSPQSPRNRRSLRIPQYPRILPIPKRAGESQAPMTIPKIPAARKPIRAIRRVETQAQMLIPRRTPRTAMTRRMRTRRTIAGRKSYTSE